MVRKTEQEKYYDGEDCAYGLSVDEDYIHSEFEIVNTYKDIDVKFLEYLYGDNYKEDMSIEFGCDIKETCSEDIDDRIECEGCTWFIVEFLEKHGDLYRQWRLDEYGDMSDCLDGDF